MSCTASLNVSHTRFNNVSDRDYTSLWHLTLYLNVRSLEAWTKCDGLNKQNSFSFIKRRGKWSLLVSFKKVKWQPNLIYSSNLLWRKTWVNIAQRQYCPADQCYLVCCCHASCTKRRVLTFRLFGLDNQRN